MRSHLIRETLNRKDDYSNKPPQYARFGRVTVEKYFVCKYFITYVMVIIE